MGTPYDVLVVATVAYSVGHAHDCTRVRAFPETPVRSYHRALAFTTTATQTLLSNSVSGYANFGGKPAPTQLTWYPTLASGTVTGQFQGAWSLTGNADYIALGGEFPSVNGTAQAGLVRFAVGRIAPNRVGPSSTTLTPSVVSLESGTVRVTWPTTAGSGQRVADLSADARRQHDGPGHPHGFGVVLVAERAGRHRPRPGPGQQPHLPDQRDRPAGEHGQPGLRRRHGVRPRSGDLPSSGSAPMARASPGGWQRRLGVPGTTGSASTTSRSVRG